MRITNKSGEYFLNSEPLHFAMEMPAGQIVSRTFGPCGIALTYDDIRLSGPSTDGERVRYEIST